MELRRLGSTGPEVAEIGLGCMGMSGMYGPSDRDESIRTIHAALDAGISLIDTGDFYGMGHNELLIAEALKGRRREEVVLSVKFGAQRGPDGSWLGYDARPQAVKTAVAYSLQRLGVDYIDVYRPARLDPAVPIEETAGAVADLIKGGYVRHLGLSEVGAETIGRAHAVSPVCDLQIEYSLLSRGIEDWILPACRRLGIGITAYGVLSRGLIGGSWTGGAGASGDFRAHSPRFQGENLERNRALVAALREMADQRGLTVASLAIAWALYKGDDIVPVVGSRRRDQLYDSLTAAGAVLSQDDLDAIEAIIPPGAAAGARDVAAQMAMLDSERKG